MATKALSNGTLSLRFMQNAQRAKQQTQVQVEQAKIIDDAEWHVSKEVQDLWGAASGSSQSSVTQETSYLPFLFPGSATHREDSDLEASSIVPGGFKGRRSFKRGREVVEETPTPKPDETPVIVAQNTTDTKHRQGKRPVAISGFRSTPAASTSKSSKNTTTVQALIHQDVDVGTDLKSARRQQTISSEATDVTATRVGFMKPAGIDTPPDVLTGSVSSKPNPSSGAGSTSRAASIVQLAKSQTITSLRKRNRGEDDSDRRTTEELTTAIASHPAGSVNEEAKSKKRKKKKKTVAVE